MSTCSEPNPLRRDGLSQAQRRLPALDPSSVKIDERTGDDLLAFAAAYANKAQVRFYAPHSADPALQEPAAAVDITTWARLMTPPAGQQLADLEARADNPPHLALFLAFLKLFGLAQDQLNAFTQRHLDFYYRDVLRLHGRPAVPDQVHLTFELARNVAGHILPAGTEFDAGLDALEQPLLYRTAAARVVGRAGLAALRTIYRPAGGLGAIRFAPNAATADGVAAPLPVTDPSWSAFGGADSWPEAEIGFALAAPVLRLAEGTRTITVTLTLAAALNSMANVPLRVQLSGPAGWLEALSTTQATPMLTRTTSTTLVFKVMLPPSEKQPVVDYNAAVLGGGYGTTAPVLRVLLPSGAAYAALRGITLRQVQIEVQVEGMQKSLVLDNDLGKLNPEKPFLPFGPVPAAGSTLYVDCPEATGKSLSYLRTKITGWVGKPANLNTYYAGYPAAYQALEDVLVDVQVQNRTLKRPSLETKLFGVLSQPTGLRVSDTDRAPEDVEFTFSRFEVPFTDQQLFGEYTKRGAKFERYSALKPLREVPEQPVLTVSERLLTLRLRQDLGQQVYAAQLTKAALDPKQYPTIPNTPYAPLAQGITLDYTANSGPVALDDDEPAAFPQRAVQLFHQGVFGSAEEHVVLKQPLAFLSETDQRAAYLLPQLAEGGTFLVGLRDAAPLETVAVLFQVAEGSANPERFPVRVTWSVLSQNQWLRLQGPHAPVDHTDQLLTSGIIEFYLPADTRLDNTLLESGLVWLKAELHLDSSPADAPLPAPADSVARLVALHPQAVLARFADGGNDPAHYAAPLSAGTITETRDGAAGLQTVAQPYPSFGGKPAETDAAFYARVSERLRHKQRAVTIWDYEHLALEQFPDLYKVQCLNHTQVLDATGSGTSELQEMAPGHVTLVAVPNLRHAYAAKPLAPKVSTRTLTALREFAQAHAGPQVRVRAVNPVYERVEVGGKVAFRTGYPAATYKQQLAQDLRAYLSPWAYAATADLTFGGTLHKSTVLAFIEQLPYVDFVTELTLHSLLPGAPPDQESIAASAAWSVLVSASDHPFVEINRPVPAPF